MANLYNRPMFKKGGRVKEEEVSYTDYGRSGVMYKDKEGNPITKEEFFRMLDREEKAGGGIMSGIRKVSHSGNDAFLEKLFEDYLEQGFSEDEAAQKAMDDLRNNRFQDLAQGGRVGFQAGGLTREQQLNQLLGRPGSFIGDTNRLLGNVREGLYNYGVRPLQNLGIYGTNYFLGQDIPEVGKYNFEEDLLSQYGDRTGKKTGIMTAASADEPEKKKGITLKDRGVGAEADKLPLYDEDETEGGAIDVSSILLPKKKPAEKPTGGETTSDELQAVRDYVKSAKALMPESDATSDLLINLGLSLISQPKRGGTLATIAEAAKKPVSEFQKAKEAERQIDVALISKGLDRLDDDDLGQITKRAKAGVKAGYFKTVEEGIKKELERIYEDDPYRKEKSPATLIEERAAENRAGGMKSGEAYEKAEFDVLVAPKIRKKGYRVGGEIPKRKGKVQTDKLRPGSVYRDSETNTYKLWTGTEFQDIKLD